MRRIIGYIGLLMLINVLMITTSVAAQLSLVSAPANSEEFSLNGKSDAFWQDAIPVNVTVNELPYEPNNGYKGDKSSDVSIKSVHDDEYVYFIFNWTDDTLDLNRFPWQKQKDGSWKQLKNKDDTHHENTYYEDKIAVYWDINQRGFIKKGCDKSCHMVEDGKIDGIVDDSSGRHYTNTNEIIDEWQWKATRINVVSQFDDGYVNDEKNTNKKWGRHSDSGAGGYYNNINASKDAPMYQNEVQSEEEKYFVQDQNKILLEDNYKKNDIVGGIITRAFTGSRADVDAKAFWDGESWTLEARRKLVTEDKIYDLQFDDLNKKYYFGVATFDNSQINHLYHKKSITFTFEQ